MERSFLCVKPDGVSRGLIGEIVSRFEKRGFRIVEMKMMQAPVSLVEEHYAEHRGKPFFDNLVKCLTCGPVVPFVVEGPVGTIAAVRTMLGATDPMKSAAGTIRGDLCTEMSYNACHASANAEDAAREIKLWFGH